MVVKLTKLKESDNPLHANNIVEGYTKQCDVLEEFFEKPTVHKPFVIQDKNSLNWFRTSTVQEILSENTFRTYNSIYKWEVIDGK